MSTTTLCTPLLPAAAAFVLTLALLVACIGIGLGISIGDVRPAIDSGAE